MNTIWCESTLILHNFNLGFNQMTISIYIHKIPKLKVRKYKIFKNLRTPFIFYLIYKKTKYIYYCHLWLHPVLTAPGHSALWLAAVVSSMDTRPASPAGGGNQTDNRLTGSDRTCVVRRSCRMASCDMWCHCGRRSLTHRKWAELEKQSFTYLKLV